MGAPDWRPGFGGGRFRVTETTADLGIEAEGPTMEAAEASAVAGLYHIITPGAQVRAERAVQVDGTAGEEGVAFARALQRLVALFDIERFIAAQATVENEPGPPARCTIHLRGESYDPARHPYGVEVKAVTHHQLVFARQLRRVAVILDI